MDRDEYVRGRNVLKRKHDEELYEHAKKFVLENAEYAVGDFVTDHIGTILVEHITIAYGFNKEYPEAVYKGTAYTKAGKPFKNGQTKSVWASNIRK